MPIFLISVPFVAVTRITTAAFYATEESIFSYVLTYTEPVFMLASYVCAAALLWRADHDLVEHSICKNIVSLFGPYFKKSC